MRAGALVACHAGRCGLRVLRAPRRRGRVMEVGDRGPGIPEDKLGAGLQPFVRLENSRSRESGGTGLGLAIAQQLAEAAGGVLKLSNREGGGLVAAVRLG
ncbi:MULTISPECIES: ATP-binding protein [Ralstonia]